MNSGKKRETKLEDILKEIPSAPEVPGGKGKFCGRIKPEPKVVLFDVYGTLVEPEIGDLEEQTAGRIGPKSFERTAERFGFDPGLGTVWQKAFFDKIRTIHEEAQALGIQRAEVLVEEIWRKLLTAAGLSLSLEEIRAVALFRESIANPVAAFQGARDCLRKLKKTGIRLGLASNSQFYTLPLLGKALKLPAESIFDPVISVLSYEYGFAKPDPHFFLLAKTKLSMLAIEPEEVLMVGNDWENDIVGANAVGFRSVFLSVREAAVKREAEGLALKVPTVYNYMDLMRALGI